MSVQSSTMPAMVSGLVMGYIMYFFFQYNGGVVNDILGFLGLSGYDWLGNGGAAIAVIVFINTWQFVGVSMVIYLAGIQGYLNLILKRNCRWSECLGKISLYYSSTSYTALSSSVIYNLIGGLKLYECYYCINRWGTGEKNTFFGNLYS